MAALCAGHHAPDRRTRGPGAVQDGLLLDLNRAGQTLVLVTHSPDLAARYAGRVVWLLDGQVTSGAAAGRPASGARP